MAWVCFGRSPPYLIDPPELKPVGFVLGWLSSQSEIPRGLGRRSEVSNLESPFLRGLRVVGPGYGKTLMERSYTDISFVFRDIPALVSNLTCSLPACHLLRLLASSFLQFILHRSAFIFGPCRICTSSSGFPKSWIGRSYSQISFVFPNIPAFVPASNP
jgi:hypothetical protein